MRNLVWHTFVILAALVLAVVAITPPETKLRLNKDLVGGTTLTYQVDVRPTDPPDTLTKVIELLKRRIDPNGLMEIQFEAQGTDRIAITMALANDSVRKGREQFEAVLQQLTQGAVSLDQLNRTLARTGPDRAAELESLSGGDADRRRLLLDASAKYDAAQAASAAFREASPALEKTIDELSRQVEEAQQRRAPQTEIDGLQARLREFKRELDKAAEAPAIAELDFEKARSAVLDTTISEAEVRRLLELPREGRSYRGAGGAMARLNSPRERALERLKTKYPSAGARIDAVVAEHDRYQSSRSSLDDPADLQRLLRGAGVLSFRITVKPGEIPEEAALRAEIREKGPKGVRSPSYHWYKINKEDAWFDNKEQEKALFTNPAGYFASRGHVVEEIDGQYWMLCYDTKGKRLTQAEGAWSLRSARPGVDPERGTQCIVFEMDSLGGEKMGQLTDGNRQNSMGVLLDDEVYTAPTIQSRIGNRGQITGNFSEAEISYIVRVLAAGSLSAKLSPEPISQVTISPELGRDNLDKGLRAGVLAFIAIAVFMSVYYFTFGFVSIVALFFNALMILAAMAAQHAAFSLPAIAGVILTFGMAVDANVLVYERIREEMSNGEDLKSALRLGFSRALSAIVDGHVTVLIVCVILGIVGTQEIKGFAITMSVGAVATLFTQLYCTRWMFTILIEKFGLRKMSMLPIAVPAIQGIFHLNVDWMRYRFIFIGFSVLLTVLCAVTLIVRSGDILDTEFTGGSKVTIILKEQSPGGPRLTMTRKEVQDRVSQLASEGEKSADPVQKAFANLREARVRVIINNTDDVPAAERGIRSSTFEIKTAITNTGLLRDGLSRVFADKMEVLQALNFDGRSETDEARWPIRPVISDQLADIPGVGLRQREPEFVGGAAVVFANFDPRPSLSSLEARVKAIKGKSGPEYAEAAARKYKWVILRGSPEAVQDAVLLVQDERYNFITDQQNWQSGLRKSSWTVLQEALGQASSSASVESFSSSVASAFRARAVIAVLLSALLITIYIWVRFASVRYSLAAIMTSLHDCLVAVGLIAMGEVIYTNTPGLAHALGILPFKIDLNVIASVLTILGYSLNDTIVVMDRIREKRGKLPYASREVINRAINDTISRTIITGGTTLIATLVLYIVGGEAVRAFAFAFVVGILVGTYSSIAVAAPIVWVRKGDPHEGDPAEGGVRPPLNPANPANPALPPGGGQPTFG